MWLLTHGADRLAGSSARGRLMKMEENDTRKYSLEELRELRERGETETRADAPVFSLEPDFWENAHVVMARSNETLRFDT
jgi:hypothetical protein